MAARAPAATRSALTHKGPPRSKPAVIGVITNPGRRNSITATPCRHSRARRPCRVMFLYWFRSVLLLVSRYLQGLRARLWRA